MAPTCVHDSTISCATGHALRCHKLRSALRMSHGCVRINLQVLYMSACGVLWTAYLSYASSVQIAPKQPAAAVQVKSIAESSQDKRKK